jgi:hypothetical protein
VISTWTKTSILSPCPYACVLCSCEHGMPCVRRLHLGDMSPCVSADCVGVSETVGVSAHALILGGLRTSSRLVGPWTCGAGGREPCSSLENAKKDSVERNSRRLVTWHAPSRLCFSPTWEPRVRCVSISSFFLFVHQSHCGKRIRTHTPLWSTSQRGELADNWTGHFAPTYLNHNWSTWQPGNQVYGGVVGFVRSMITVLNPRLIPFSQ